VQEINKIGYSLSGQHTIFYPRTILKNVLFFRDLNILSISSTT